MAGAVPEDGLSLKDMVFLSGGPRDWTGFQRAEVGGEGHARLPDSRSCGLKQDCGGDGSMDGWGEGSTAPANGKTSPGHVTGGPG